MLIALLLATSAATSSFDPLRFFAGSTRGDGTLKVVLRRRVPVTVSGRGSLELDGSLLLDQIVVEGGKPPRRRQWRLRRVSSSRYEGSLTDAAGSVVGEMTGSRLHISFTTPSGFKVQQWLTPAPDGRSVDNLLVARRLGVIVARLRERIVKVG